MFPADRGSVYHREGAFKEAKVLILAGLTARWNRGRTRRSEEPLRRRFDTTKLISHSAWRV